MIHFQKSKRFGLAVLGAAVVLSAVSIAGAEDVWSKNPLTSLRAAPKTLSDEVCQVDKGAKLTVLAREGNWLKVSIEGKQGYIPEKLVSTTEVKAETDMLGGLRKEASTVNANAARGDLEDETKAYASGAHLSDAVVKWLDGTFRKGLVQHSSELDTFMQQGKVGDYAPRK